jgi:galactose oxidase
MVSGGQTNILTSIYNPVTDLWTTGKRMNIGRGYQSQVTLSDGRVFTFGGSWNGGLGGKIGEVYTEFPNGTASWRQLPGISTIPSVLTNDTQGIYRADNHMWFFEHTDGRILQAGPSKQMHWITLDGNGTITPTVYVWLSRVRGLGSSTRFALTPVINHFSVSEATTTTQ